METLKARAEKTLAVGKGRLVGSSGDILDGAASVEESGSWFRVSGSGL